MPTNDIKKIPLKNIEICSIYDQFKGQNHARAHIYMGIAFRLITPSFFIQFQIFLYPDTQETESFHGLGPKIKMTSAVPIYGQARSPRPDGRVSSETPPKGAPMGGACWAR